MRRTLVFDIDGVLAEFCYDFTELAASIGLVRYPWYGSEQTEWNFKFHVDPVWAIVDRLPSFWYDLPPLVSKEDLASMHEAAKEYNIFYVTGRQGYTAAEQTIDWLKNFEFPQGALFLSEPKTDKLPILIPHKYSIAGVLDDKPSLIEALRARGIPATARLWKYTKHLEEPLQATVKGFIDAV